MGSRGLVAGQVQSGKTGNYTGLIAKALDSGYKLIVVLAGVHNSLRSQTQARIDEGILGFDTRNALRFDQTDGNRIGVGQLAGPCLHVSSFTSSSDKGDFNLSVAQDIGVAVGGEDPDHPGRQEEQVDPRQPLQVVDRIWKGHDPDTGKFIVRGVPVLVIDDEADHASVNTKFQSGGRDEVDPSAINGLIRKFLTPSSSPPTSPTPRPRSRTSSSSPTRSTQRRSRTCSPQLHHQPSRAEHLHRPRAGLRAGRERQTRLEEVEAARRSCATVGTTTTGCPTSTRRATPLGDELPDSLGRRSSSS